MPLSATRLIRIRHRVQWALLALFLGLPFTGLFRVDVAAGRFLVGDWQVWWDDFAIVFGFWAVVFFSMTALYSNLGMIFCGWMCPQHTLSEWLNGLIRALLGRRVLAGISPERQEGRSKRQAWQLVLAWAAFVAVVLAASAVITLACLHYFFSTRQLWAHFSGGAFNLYIAVFAVMLGAFVVIDLGLLRHFWCKYMCPYGIWQYMFRGRDTLQIRFDTAREGDCRSCSLCKDVCPVDLDPRQPEVYTRCINCAVCIGACEGYMGRFDKAPILAFGFGTRAQEQERLATRRRRLLSPGVLWPLSGVAAGLLLLVTGLASFQPVKVSLGPESQSATPGADGIGYRASVLNKDRRPHRFTVAAAAPEGGRVQMDVTALALESGERADFTLRVPRAGLQYDRPYTVRLLVSREGSAHPFEATSTWYIPAPLTPDGSDAPGAVNIPARVDNGPLLE
ncbi:MAG: 4Fe-4S binding protein [Nitrospirota bacterium]|nr:4Fe-4S binding protein [Nitrospirota bacterium]